MTIIVHRIRLHEGVEPERFENWVRDVDYATCPELPSLLAFGVQQVVATPAEPSAADAGPVGIDGPRHYFEIIEVTSLQEFEGDMESSQFQRLVAEFEQMAKVVDEVTGERIGDGYRA
ncbi:RedY protein [Streptomyces sp. NBC_00996]|uniref:RedY protein n=1 Tax=Streptomyces sp. NBC_00996 TaxID=2903710 RepID=UPI003868625D|nr:RedY protein [Streptomyces sp. NBC_00996]